jgi:hypothetical protein
VPQPQGERGQGIEANSRRKRAEPDRKDHLLRQLRSLAQRRRPRKSGNRCGKVSGRQGHAGASN